MEKKENAKHYRNMSITLQMDTLAFDKKSDTYTMSAYLIAQLGKNFTNGADKKLPAKNYSYWHGTKLKRYNIWAEA